MVRKKIGDGHLKRNGVVGHPLKETAVMAEELVLIRRAAFHQASQGHVQHRLDDRRVDDVLIDRQPRRPAVGHHVEHIVIVRLETLGNGFVHVHLGRHSSKSSVNLPAL